VRSMVLGFCLSLAMASGASAQDSRDRLQQLHDALHLSAEQEVAWRDYAAAITPNAQATARRHAIEQLLPQLKTPRRIALIDATMAQDAADFRGQGEMVKAFYAHLSPEQRLTFDRETLPTGAGQSGQ
jgi:protein CpxP